ncbi:hypothetical protein E8E12_008643 [Didymella heteroderae]|uniref:Uncharacterized protein n=1 Tax=Didymella heteroderae TaxID=1769908 RepID=A0A9P4WWQ3_9PLEO|nr:hypothetical protein E8E12_008643 [Didymella heteroderae]
MAFPRPAEDPDFHEEMWLRYPLAQDVVPYHYAHTITARQGLGLIMNNIIFNVRDRPKEAGSLTTSEALDLKARLDMWYDSLPPPMQAANIVFPPQLEVHLEYHSIVIELYQRSDAAIDPTYAARMLKTSNIRVETILRLYHLRHSLECYTIFTVWIMVYVGNLCLNSVAENSLPNATADEIRSSLLLCANGLKGAGRSYHFAKLAYYALSQRMSAYDLSLLRTFSGPEDGAMDELSLMRNTHSTWPVPIVKPDEDADKARQEKLAKDTHELAMR